MSGISPRSLSQAGSEQVPPMRDQPSIPGPRQRLGEQPAAPRPRILCVGPPGARSPAQASHPGTEEAERTGSRGRGETGEEPARATVTTITIIITTTTTTTTIITGRNPSHSQPHLPSHGPVQPNFIRRFACRWVVL
ncbi:uncharacterized protein LOC131480964 isoform X2 [Ochotona princeps]|uniref:uncharacterized protein LOC131480964 isoform X2 n=1 Tax=Ochotona princeps TaxID=9978 RepID=UPI0027148D50|nr:uncharacterized protein LOC131480964 isoform X2 [Ochotona princeps]